RAAKELEALEQMGGGDALATYRSAVARELLGDRGAALEALEKALQKGFSIEEARQDPELVELRTDVGYHRILIAMGRAEDA
ncbi:MAG: hypothetical protein AAF657_39725, partial [Acidobacteriota bacterium]